MCFFYFFMYLFLLFSEVYGLIFYYNTNTSTLNKIEYNRDDMYIQAIPYYQEICPRIQNNFVKLLTECDSSPFEIGNSMSKIYSNNFFIRFIYKFKIFGFSSYYKFYTYGASVEYILKNPKMFLFPNPLKKAKEKKLVGDYQLSSHFASHSAFIGIFQHFGIIYGLLFLFNIIYFLYNSKDKLVFPIFIASAFFTIDIILLFPIIILNNVITDKKFISK